MIITNRGGARNDIIAAEGIVYQEVSADNRQFRHWLNNDGGQTYKRKLEPLKNKKVLMMAAAAVAAILSNR